MHPSHSDEPSRVVVYEYAQGEQRLPASFEIEPSLHTVHAEAPPLDAVPAPHEMQKAALSFENVPAPHVVHDDSPVAALLPAAQPMQAKDPLMGECVPAPQGMHEAAPSDE